MLDPEFDWPSCQFCFQSSNITYVHIPKTSWVLVELCTSHSSLGGGSVPFTCFWQTLFWHLFHCAMFHPFITPLIHKEMMEPNEKKMLESCNCSPSVNGTLRLPGLQNSNIKRSREIWIAWREILWGCAKPWSVETPAFFSEQIERNLPPIGI